MKALMKLVRIRHLKVMTTFHYRPSLVLPLPGPVALIQPGLAELLDELGHLLGLPLLLDHPGQLLLLRPAGGLAPRLLQLLEVLLLQGQGGPVRQQGEGEGRRAAPISEKKLLYSH